MVSDIDEDFINEIKKNFKDISLNKSYTSEGIIIGIIMLKVFYLKGINKKEKNIIRFF